MEYKEMSVMLNRVDAINRISCGNIETGEIILAMFNELYGTRFGFLAERVVRFDNPDGSVAERYAHCHDVHAELWSKLWEMERKGEAL